MQVLWAAAALLELLARPAGTWIVTSSFGSISVNTGGFAVREPVIADADHARTKGVEL